MIFSLLPIMLQFVNILIVLFLRIVTRWTEKLGTKDVKNSRTSYEIKIDYDLYKIVVYFF